ncbi:MAG: carbamate kinase [bacterium]|nr:carbamate kinase [bacterium]
MQMKNTAVVAIGGNFLSDGKSPTEEQMKRANKAAELVKLLIQKDFSVVVVHGNGPQVGMTYLRQLAGKEVNIPPLNLALCNALTQAEIGTLLHLAIINSVNLERRDFRVMTFLSQVEVDRNDPAFQNPTKPIGPFMTEDEAELVKKTFPDWTIIEDSGRGYRRVVPSPVPIKVFSAASISDTFKTTNVIIAGGGGGIPVVRDPVTQTFDIVDSVIDKDRTAFLIAQEIDATHFFLLTGVPHVSIDFGTPREKRLLDISVAEARRYLAEGQFPPGSMGPKVESAINFAESTGGTAVITDPDHIAEALEGKEGTRIHQSIETGKQ